MSRPWQLIPWNFIDVLSGNGRAERWRPGLTPCRACAWVVRKVHVRTMYDRIFRSACF